ncbi:Histone deacetylase superfamily [Penicillium robsamsonii]|uniref:Histone deacetylase superfamily n=1 Tax=Penicillium robsamsonii TaxID=1792511 RepID=UPI002546AE0E|nr:Histone deacetylase superfamily [Penicillium robsamsonii]KAJ5837143.1 Histone deacetylase superfamily [Penicillium robsamsonii]
MDEDEDTVMGDSHNLSTLTTNPSFTQVPLPTHLSNHPTPNIAPSSIPQPGPTSLSPGSEQSQPRETIVSTGMAPPERLTKTSDSDSSVAEQLKRDSLVEPDSDWSDDEVMAKAGLPLASLATGLCYDHRMRYHCEVRPQSDVHPEDPRRIYYIYKELCRAGLVDDPESSRPLAPKTLQRIHARNATEEEVTLIHNDAHYAFVRSTTDMPNEVLIQLEKDRDSIYFNNLTFASAILSTGGAIETCLAVAQRQVRNAIAVIRPPGHHAEDDAAMGFCLFNNVSVAARVCQNRLGDACRKIMILDWDVHHGNGIQKAFYDDPNVLYISMHVYQDGRFYPGGPAGDWDQCGSGAGVGKNVNIPWPDQGMGDGDYMFAFQEVVMPIAQEFDPDLVIIAAGFDAAAGDVLGGCFVSPACYAQMTHMLMTLANGKVAVCLEGGYNFKSISKSALAVTKTLMGEPPDRLLSSSPTDSAVAAVRRVRSIQSQYWNHLYPKTSDHPVFANRLHDVLRVYQSNQLYESCKLTPLHIYRTAISKSFDKQVLASTNYHQRVPLIVIFHDPPEIVGQPHPVTNKLEAHNVWMADSLTEYVKWIVGKGYAVIDVNVPKHVSREAAAGQYKGDDEDRPSATEELAGYLWDNYIDANQATEIFLLGVGNAFLGVSNLLMNRENLYKRVSGVVSFVSENALRAVASHTQTWLSKWYRENSLVFVSNSHGVWNDKDRKPLSKRYGQVVRSPKSNLNEMLDEHKEEVYKWISERADREESDEDS